jgi:hypothetical protein
MNSRGVRQKSIERDYLDAYLRLTAQQAEVEHFERPDFILTNSSGRWGVEVTEVLQDSGPHGSLVRRDEQERARFLARLAKVYYAAGGRPVLLKLTLPRHPSANFADDLAGRMLAERTVVPEGEQRKCYLRPAVEEQPFYLTALTDEFPAYSRWLSIGDGVGWVRSVESATLNSIIATKAGKLAEYRMSVPRVVLLIVANRLLNSGKFQLSTELQTLDALGFEEVYLLVHPLTVHRLA